MYDMVASSETSKGEKEMKVQIVWNINKYEGIGKRGAWKAEFHSAGM